MARTEIAAVLPAGGVFRSGVIDGFWLQVEWLWQEPTDKLGALKELGLLR